MRMNHVVLALGEPVAKNQHKLRSNLLSGTLTVCFQCLQNPLASASELPRIDCFGARGLKFIGNKK